MSYENNAYEDDNKTSALDCYCKDLTALARQDKIDPVIGRDEEIRRVMQVLCRRTKNTPVIIGENNSCSLGLPPLLNKALHRF